MTSSVSKQTNGNSKMSLDSDEITLRVQSKDRAYKIEIFYEYGAEPIVRVLREIININTATSLPVGAAQNRDIICERRYSQFTNETVTGVTGAQLFGLIRDRANTWRQQDLDRLK